MSIRSVDIRLCTDAACATSVADFTALNGVCSSSPTGSTLVYAADDATSAHLQAFSDHECSTPPTLEIELTLDGAVHSAPPLWYTAALTQACQAPDPFIGYYATIVGASGRQPGDMGNLDACLFGGFQHCVIRDRTSGLFAGACLPRNCGPSDVTNISSPIWPYLSLLNPTFPYLLAAGNASSLYAYCGTQEFSIDSGSGASWTIAGIALAAALVLAATIYAVAFPRAASSTASPAGSKPPPRAVAGEASAPLLPAPLDGLLRSASLSTSLPRLLGSASAARARDESAPQLAAFDGVRVLSLSLVVLGHSFAFPSSLTGYSNGLGIYAEVGKAAMQVIPSAEFAVDSFFALSGALGALLLSRGLRVAFAKAAAAEGWGADVAAATPGGGYAAAGKQQRSALLAISFGLPLLAAVDGDAEQQPGSTPGATDDGDDDEDYGGVSQRRLVQQQQQLLLLARAARVSARGALATLGAWAYATIHRYLRLVPSVGVMIAVFTYVAPLMGSGPYWREGWTDSVGYCTDHAWADLTFLNNYKPGDQDGRFNRQCAGWLWYLAVDFQLHLVVLAPLCAAFAAWAPVGWAALLALVAASMTLSGFAVRDKGLSFLNFIAPGSQLANSGQYYQDYFYDLPVDRAPAFLVGVGLGWALVLWQEREAVAVAKRAADAAATDAAAASHDASGAPIQQPPTATTAALRRLASALLPMRADGSEPDAAACLVLTASLLGLGLLFYVPTGAYQGELGATAFSALAPAPYAGASRWSVAQQQAYTIASRPLWALGLCVLLYMCATRRGGVLGFLLGYSPLWRPVATLAFGAYLYHPVVLFVLNLSVDTPPRYTPAALATMYAATCVFSVLAAGIAYCIVEAPAAALEKLVLDSALRAVAPLLGARAGRGAAKH